MTDTAINMNRNEIGIKTPNEAVMAEQDARLAELAPDQVRIATREESQRIAATLNGRIADGTFEKQLETDFASVVSETA